MERKSAPKRKTHARADKHLLITIGGLLLFGVIMIANATALSSNSLYDNPYKFVLLQMGWIFVGAFGFFLFYFMSMEKMEKLAYLLFLVSLSFLLILALFGILPCNADFSMAPCVNGANRWLFLNPPPLPQLPFIGVAGFQPAEFAKLSLILYLSFQLAKVIKSNDNPFKVYLVISGLVSFLIILQPNMSTAAMIFAIGTIIYFASESSLKPLMILVPVVLLIGISAILLSPYRRERLMTLINGSESNTERTTGYHIKQVQIALGSGGFFGVGFGQSKQKYQYLPEVASDSIFAIIGEEFGFIGTTIIIFTFLYLMFRGYLIAKNSTELSHRLLAVGITSWLGLQFFVNVAAMSKIIPLTGVPIPLISYGGSSLVFSLMGLGILANISRKQDL